jgi:DNA segregation ATPase FtsK/SpoIIIE, S-DNA-T family
MRVVLENPSAGALDTELRVGDPAATVADLLDELGVGEQFSGVVIDGRFCHRELALAEIGLYEGARVAPAQLAPSGDGVREALQLRVISGLEAGRRMPLTGTGVVVGRELACDLVLEDGSVSRRHLRVVPSAGGLQATLTDLGSANGTWLEGRRISAPAEVAVGAIFEAGDVAFTLAAPAPGLELDPLREAGPAGTIPFNRPPRARSASPRAALHAPERPADPAPPRFSWASAIGPLILGGVMVVLLHSAVYALFMLLSPVLVAATWIEGRRHARRTASGHSREHMRELARFDAALTARQRQERDERRAQLPDLGEIVQRACAPDPRLWERRGDDEDFLALSGGLGELLARPELDSRGPPAVDAEALLARRERLNLVPVPVPLAAGAVGIVGPRAKALAVARGLVCQAAVLHGPADLILTVLSDPDRAGAWDWAKWLPHCRDACSGGARALIATAPQLVAELSAELTEAAQQSQRTILAVLDGDALIEGRDALGRALLRAGPRVSGIVIARSVQRLPAACTTVIEVGEDGAEGTIRRPQAGERSDAVLIAGISEPTARSCALALARFEDPELRLPGGAIPDTVALTQLLGLGAIDADHLRARWERAVAAPGLAARFALGEDGPFVVDLVNDGPHGLIAGTTGAGKSELLRSLVAALATEHSPERVNFVLIDYKGASAFGQCGALPHSVGLVTDLDEQLGARALESLEAELRQRERILREHRCSDLIEYGRLAADGRANPLPRLLVIIDEFATLAAELPDFITALVGVAQRGRSLGVHLLLATQRPSGAVNENIRANTNLRVCLRVQAAQDSADVIDDPAAALIPRTQPGRAYVRLGPGELVPVQVALVSGISDRVGHRAVQLIPFTLGPEAAPPTAAPSPAAPRGASDLERIVAAAREAHGGLAPPRRPWLEPLPAMVALDALPDLGPVRALAGDRGVLVALGVADDPGAQSQYPVGWNLNSGNLLIYGVLGSGVTTALATVALSLSALAAPDLVHIYVLDFGAGELGALAGLPHVAAVIAAGEHERQRRLLRYLHAQLDERRGLTAAQRAGLPRVVLLIDGYSGFAAEQDGAGGEGLREALARVWADGPELGVHAAISADRVGAVPSSIASLAQQRLVLQLADVADYGQFGIRRHQIPRFTPGRALHGGTAQVLQIAHPGPLARAVAAAADRAPAAAPRPPGIEVLPAQVSVEDVLHTLRRATAPDDGALVLPLGLGDEDLRAAGFALYPGEHALIAGPARSGKSTALLALAACAARVAPELERIGVALRRSPLADSALLSRVVSGAPELEALLAQLRGSARPALVLIDDAEGIDDSTRRLTDALGAPEPGFHAVVAGRTEGLSAIGHWTMAVRRSRVGLLLMPNVATDGSLLGVTLPRRPPPPRRPGCGYLVGPRGLELVQVASPGAPAH